MRIERPCKKHGSAISSLLRMVKMNHNGIDDEVRYFKRGYGELPCPEGLWYSNDSEATLNFSEEVLISEGKITEDDEIKSDWKDISNCGDIYTS
ncbi:MAG: hypothetical protein A2X09_15545 [Bacteroidetes bacterium GWF2_43_11]|nr:MAG: hypothetical protein A2X09_15545 [Bacteroidetes bacterium GWF2_43_11]